IGQNSTEVQGHLARGYVEAALIAIPVAAERMAVRPVARDELVYVSTNKRRLERPVTGAQLAKAELVLPETTYRDDDSSRRLLRELVQRTGNTLRTKIEVEDAETAVELVEYGIADSVLPLGAVRELLPRLAPNAGWVSLRPRTYDVFALVHRRDAVLSPAALSVIELATRLIRAVAEPVH
ncbi:MAG TPA: LysR family transcriptional regulator substrate-binding protein, partial [Nocardioidaceae bacterium]|nr:LysR family transcriptional regulator substrate-binding protein [Nocardioidaceae bacterium]